MSGMGRLLLRAFVIAFAMFVSVCRVSAQRGDSDDWVAYVVTNDTIICDAGVATVSVKLNLPQAEQVTLHYRYGGVRYQYSVTTGKDSVVTFSVPVDLSFDPERRHAHYNIEMVSLFDQKQFGGSVDLADSMIVDVWATPRPEILNDDKTCGYEVSLRANTKWSDISSYVWNNPNNEGTISDGESSTATFGIDRTTSVQFSLTETTGGKCSSMVSKTIQMLGSPKASIKHVNEGGVESDVMICSSIPDDDAFAFDGMITLKGSGKFDVYLSNGQSITGLHEGTSLQRLTMKTGGEVSITKVIDGHECVSLAKDLTGVITVYDRVPPVVSPLDTAIFDTREVSLPRELDVNSNSCEWALADGYQGYDIRDFVSDKNDGLSFYTTMHGLIGFDYYEVRVDDGLVDCPSNVITQYVYINAVLEAPTGFSPNGDGVNDCLVINGIPANNHILVVDNRGKAVYEADNYRNDWNAEGVEDGYYVYVFTGEGVKTVKQTLVIKRSK